MSVGLRTDDGKVAQEAVRRWPLRRWSIGHVAVAVAAMLAFVANLAFLRSRDDATRVVVAARTIEAGEVIGSGALTTTMLRADAGILATLLTSVDSGVGRVARRPLAKGELVGSGDLLSTAAPDGLASMSVPIDPSHAAGGTIRVGDLVDVVDVDDDGTGEYVVRDAPVLAVSDAPTGALAGASRSHVVLGLAEDQVLAVAEAIADGEIDVVITTGLSDG